MPIQDQVLQTVFHYQGPAKSHSSYLHSSCTRTQSQDVKAYFCNMTFNLKVLAGEHQRVLDAILHTSPSACLQMQLHEAGTQERTPPVVS